MLALQQFSVSKKRIIKGWEGCGQILGSTWILTRNRRRENPVLTIRQPVFRPAYNLFYKLSFRAMKDSEPVWPSGQALGW